MRTLMKWTLLLGFFTCMAAAAELKDSTRTEFNTYVGRAEASFLARRTSPETILAFQRLEPKKRADAEARLRRGEVLVEKIAVESLDSGMVHHWRGTAFVPSASIAQALAAVQDYDSFARNFQPEVLRSSLVSKRGDDFRFDMRLRKHKVLTVVLDTSSRVRFERIDAARVLSVARMDRIVEVEGAGQGNERLLPPGKDSGFLWDMETLWSYVQVPAGVFIECETISLTRDIPFGLKYLIGPFIEGVPRESLEFTLRATRNAISQKNLSANR